MKGECILPVERLGETPETFHFEVSSRWWAARDDATVHADAHTGDCEVETPFTFDLTAVRVRHDVMLEGRLGGQVGLECSRCAKRYSAALHDDFRLLLEPAGTREPADPEGAVGLAENGLYLGEDLEAGWFRGPRIGLDDFFGELIALGMPVQPLCSEECPGLCAHCGADLASSPCDCVDERIGSPFAVLARWKGMKGMKGGRGAD